MGKVKDFMTEPDAVDPTEDDMNEVSYQEVHEYYDAKYRGFDTDVVQFNSNLLSIIEGLKAFIDYDGQRETKLSKESEKTILSCIKLLKLEEDKEK